MPLRVHVARSALALVVLATTTLAAGCVSQRPTTEGVAEEWVRAVIAGDDAQVRALTEGGVIGTDAIQREREILTGSKDAALTVTVRLRRRGAEWVTISEVALEGAPASSRTRVPGGYELWIPPEQPLRVWGRFGGEGVDSPALFTETPIRQ